MPVADVAIKGTHNPSQCAGGLSPRLRPRASHMEAMLDTLKTYTGLPHRCEHVAD